MGRTFSSLRYFNYRIWFFSALVANTGTWMQRVAQDWLVLAILTDDNSFAIGVVTALQFAPILFIMPFAGSLADRFDKRKIVLLTQSVQALLAFALGGLVLAGVATTAIVCGFAFLLGVANAFDNPSRLVFVSELVPPRDLPNAIGLNSTSFNVARLIGPALAGVLVAVVGAGWVFLINGFSFIATIVALLLMRPAEFFTATSPRKPREKGRIRAGLRYVRSRSDLKVIFAVTGVIACLGMNFQLTTASMARVVFDKQAGEYGLLGSVLAIGSLTGALLAARRRSQPRVRLVVAMAFAFALAAGVNAVMPTYPTYAISLIPVGLVILTLLTSANTSVQMSTEPEMRGRVMSLYQTVMQGSAPVGSLIVGWICEVISPRWGVGIGAIGALIVGIAAYIWGRRNWDVAVHYHWRSHPHLEIIGPLERQQEEHGEGDGLGAGPTPGDHAK